MNVRWIARFYAGLQGIQTARGRRLLLTPNFDLGGRWDDASTLAIGNSTDGVLSECSFTGCGQRLVVVGINPVVTLEKQRLNMIGNLYTSMSSDSDVLCSDNWINP